MIKKIKFMLIKFKNKKNKKKKVKNAITIMFEKK